MKSLLLLCFSAAFFGAGAQKVSLLPRIGMNTATGEQRHKFKNAYGLGLGMEMGVTKQAGLKVFAHADAAINGMTSEPHEFMFRNTITQTTITHTSFVGQLGAGLRYVFNEGKTVAPYTGIGAGFLFYETGYTIQDPKNPDGCHALESESIQSDNAFTGRLEGGLRLATKWGSIPGRPVYLDFGMAYLRGTPAEYIHLSKHGDYGEGTAYSVKFQTPTQEVHEHAIGTTYRTLVSQVMFHIGAVIPLGGSKSSKAASGRPCSGHR